MNKIFLFVITAIVGLTLLTGVTFAAERFYEGKTIRLIVGTAPGGGFDTFARLIGRHMGKHIQGNPTIVIMNMPGAGGLIAANHLYKIAKPDGLTIGFFNGSLILNQAMGQPGVEFDAPKFEYIGAPFGEAVVCWFTKASGITSIDKWMASKTPVKMGGIAPGVMVDNVIRVVKAALGLPIQLISGYIGGSSEMLLAAGGGELAGTGQGWNSLKAMQSKSIEKGDLVVVLQTVPKALPDLPNVPLAINLAKTDESRQLIEVGIHSPNAFIRPFVLPPGTRKEQVQIIRKAFQETLKDKELLVEAEKAKMDLDPVLGDELAEAVAKVFKIDSSMKAKLKNILYN